MVDFNDGNLYCTLYFEYEKWVPKLLKPKLEHDFLELRKQAVKELNPRYKEWNLKYTDQVKGDDDPKYNKYMAEKQGHILKRINANNPKSWVRLNNGEYNDIIGIIKGCNIKMELFLNLLNEKEWKAYHSKEGA